MKLKKLLAFILSTALLFNFSSYKKAKAVDFVTVSAILTIGGVIVTGVKYLVDGSGKIIKVCHDANAVYVYDQETNRYKGVRSMQEATRMIRDVAAGTSPIKIYGQERAKAQCLDALAGCIENIYSEMAGTRRPTDRRGNVVYMIGGSGVGKTTMAKAIADSLLRHSGKTSTFIDSSQISRDQPLGEQLFRLTNRIGNLKNPKTVGNVVWDAFVGGTQGEIMGTYDARVPCRLLEHLFRWGEFGAVVIIDEFEKMKAICTPPEALDGYQDKSADETIKSISANGYYMVGTEKVDCSKTLFILTTNETREQLDESFGQGGARGGGVQRLNIVEFEELDIDCCRRIINDMVSDINQILTNPQGRYRIKRVQFSEETLDSMAHHILNDKLKQARAKFDLEQKIYRLFTYELDQNVGKSFSIDYVPSEHAGEVGTFSKNEIEIRKDVEAHVEDSLKTQVKQLAGSSMEDFLQFKRPRRAGDDTLKDQVEQLAHLNMEDFLRLKKSGAGDGTLKDQVKGLASSSLEDFLNP